MRVSELSGHALDAWVARAVGREEPGAGFAPSEIWDDAAPILEESHISLDRSRGGSPWIGRLATSEAVGPTPLIAAMRALVTARFGDDVPESGH